MRTCDWKGLVALDGWTAIDSLSASPVYLSPHLVRLCDDAYTVPSRHAPNLESISFDVAGLILWAPDEGVARRVLSMEIERDVGTVGIVPEPLRVCEPMRYGAIVRALRQMRDGSLMETASYRVAKDGAFIHRSIRNSRYAFFFRALSGDTEVPYAAEVRPPMRMSTGNGTVTFN